VSVGALLPFSPGRANRVDAPDGSARWQRARCEARFIAYQIHTHQGEVHFRYTAMAERGVADAIGRASSPAGVAPLQRRR